jgi:hypothetical protein
MSERTDRHSNCSFCGMRSDRIKGKKRVTEDNLQNLREFQSKEYSNRPEIQIGMFVCNKHILDATESEKQHRTQSQQTQREDTASASLTRSTRQTPTASAIRHQIVTPTSRSHQTPSSTTVRRLFSVGTSERASSSQSPRQPASSTATREEVTEEIGDSSELVPTCSSELDPSVRSRDRVMTIDVPFARPSITKDRSTFSPEKKRGEPGVSLIPIPYMAILDAYQRTNILIPIGNVCSPESLDETGNCITEEALHRLTAQFVTTRMTARAIEKLVKDLARLHKNKRFINKFETVKGAREKDLQNYCGVNKRDFGIIVDFAKQNNAMINSGTRTVSQAISIYLQWLRSGLSQKSIATVLEMNEENVRDCVTQSRAALTKNFAWRYIGAGHKTYDQFIEQQSEISKHLFGCGPNDLIVLMDATVSLRKENIFYSSKIISPYSIVFLRPEIIKLSISKAIFQCSKDEEFH